ncbi:dimethyl sulfoxide reductase anchor subunit family protein [Hydrogenophilus thiooxidans]|uniref:dimethyl sulfoxide reductase anchor subunit family protein n=1 Tax=Hydrogenophilus thiooxidans TaxID=2820326 RepID=UPI001C2474F8|nr:DmsC/YnfH family molybdoenzyme membrane anchor subunit [Hydrogenophilus thiooxidans]
MRPAFSVLFLTTLIGAAQGAAIILYALFLAKGSGPDAPLAFYLTTGGVSLLLLAAGLVASFFHLGHPERAWRAVTCWRTSWLSREVIVLPLFGFAELLWLLLLWQGDWRAAAAWGSVMAFLAIALYVCTGMIYAAVKVLREWAHPITVVNYLLMGVASGALLTAGIAEGLAPAVAPMLAKAALWLTLIALVGRGVSLWRNARIPPYSTARAIGVHHQRIRQISQGSMGGNYNMREYFHGQPPEVVRAVLIAALGAGFLAPVVLLLLGVPALLVFLLQYGGLLAERWYFFAEARHPQNLYYQVV